ncbi:MAG TPA: radical SAM protein [Syntrophales bacterium]|nr:radical SAM protein [Syntrophales bacterium]HPX10877.1 radical SAM protein [Syntrophales bacterium]HQN79064.1 radical SAM protein [Syntrophales bacterium]HQQ28227.1 radical SAM protein [Syntrophales bacterium]
MIISFFLRNRGCRHRCIFCSERVTGGEGAKDLTEDFFRETVEKHLRTGGERNDTEIAFYGGNFLEMEDSLQSRLLRFAGPYVAGGQVRSVRVATRPDSITGERLRFLSENHVETIEIGAQSLVDAVLENARRGHTADDVRKAVRLSLAHGFRTGVHLMTGLPGERQEDFLRTVGEVEELRPHTVRVHPVLVFRNTALAEAFRSGTYVPLSLEEAAGRCSLAMERFERAGISVIRVGLQETEALKEELIAGPHHPALRHVIESARFLERAKRLLADLPPGTGGGKAVFRFSPADGSSFRGIRKENLKILQKLFPLLNIGVREDEAMKRGSLSLALAAPGNEDA